MPEDTTYLGLDSSTQSLKATVINKNLDIVYEQSVNFGRELPEFNTEDGIHRHPDGLTVTSPPLMWVCALDLLFQKMKKDGFNFSSIKAISGSGQQHGSVWLKKGARKKLNNLDPEKSLKDQLQDIFSLQESPIWMDASTTKECRELEAFIGGPQALADLTGSRGYERFTGNQIAKIYRRSPKIYEDTERIALVSSFMSSLLIGDYAPIDPSDGSGMNLMDIRTKKWINKILNFVAPNLEIKLGEIMPAYTSAGNIHKYFVKKFGFNPSCRVIVFSGDNPNSLAGLRLQNPGDIAVSLGTSDTMFGVTHEPKPSGIEGHIFANPVDPNSYMVMLVRLNGSLARERIKNEYCNSSWERFGEMLRKIPAGCKGYIGFYFFDPEITPPLQKTGIYRFDPEGRVVKSFPEGIEPRAIIESQFMCLKVHSKELGLYPKTLVATGGASINKDILQVLSDVFGLPVFTSSITASAALGAAYRAMHGDLICEKKKFIHFSEIMKSASPFYKAVEPNLKNTEIYDKMSARYKELEKRIVK